MVRLRARASIRPRDTRIAARLEQFAFTADRPRRRVRTPPLQEAGRPNQESLIALLARTLRHERLSYAHGIASLELLLSDGTGPGYTDASGERLAHHGTPRSF